MMTPTRFFEVTRLLGFKKRTALAVLCLDLLGVLLEGLGIGMILPILDYVDAGGDIGVLAADSMVWTTIVSLFDSLGLTINLPALLVTAFVFLGASIALVYVRTVYAARVRYVLIRDVRSRAFQRYLDVRLSYSEADELGKAVNDFTTETERGASCVFQVLTLIGAAVLIVVYFGLALAVSVPMTLAVLPIIILAAFAARGMINRSRSIGDELTESNQRLGRFLVERLGSLRLIRLSGTEEAEVRAMEQLTGYQADRYLLAEALGARVAAVVELLAVVALLGFLYLGFMLFDLSLGETGLFLTAMLRLMPRVKEILRTRQALMIFLASLGVLERRNREMLHAGETVGGTRRLQGVRRSIDLRDVSFFYEDAKASALNGVNLTIPAMQMTALVGPSGAGKSTLIDLLPRLRVPTSGEIKIDGIALAEFDLKSLRDNFAYAPQTPQVFNASAGEHIGYGRPHATREDIVAAAKLAGAHEFITALPRGYDTSVGEDGIHLSGGQRQRLDLARTLVSGASILVLDEPTSNLDADAEEAFRDALQRVRDKTNMTIIVVGHRLSTVTIADRIVVLIGGKIADVGTHQELLVRGGWYARAFAKQQGSVDVGLAASLG